MNSGTLLFLGVRVLHVVLAGLWLGAAFFVTVFLAPAVFKLGPVRDQVIAALVRRGLVPFMASIGGITVVSGLYLFMRLDPMVRSSRGGMAYNIGALTGVIALILGGSMIGRSAKRIAAISEKVASMPESSERAALMNEMATLRGRMQTSGMIVVVLLLISMATMSLGHYI
jgi:hypothetical protein